VIGTLQSPHFSDFTKILSNLEEFFCRLGVKRFSGRGRSKTEDYGIDGSGSPEIPDLKT
jgi:hypothetical protein